MTEQRHKRAYCILAGALLVFGCAGHSFLVPNPPQSDSPLTDTGAAPDTLDFARAFIDTSRPPENRTRVRAHSDKAPAVRTPSRMARVLLEKSVRRSMMYASVSLTCRGGGRPETMTGGIAIERSSGGVRISSGGRSIESALPCTLFAESSRGFVEIGDVSYRGSVIVISRGTAAFSLINYLDVEQYLRGVVPLELGRRPLAEIEALKAQAIAARTYTYRKILERQRAAYDLVPTVADQVYGGASAENVIADRAITQTRNRVITHADTLIFAYYHSTCGGRTANVEDVWNKPAYPYLRSRSDSADGVAYCGISRYFTWRETWSRSAFSAVLTRYANKAFPHLPPCHGLVKNLHIDKRYTCGRVAGCRVSTTRGSWHFGGDKIRFAFRRDAGDHPILRSAGFTITALDRNRIELSGRGYGHGVGMCQMGAIGRARAGQTYREILTAYYTDVDIGTVMDLD